MTIKIDKTTKHLAQQVARQMGESVHEAIRKSLEQRLQRLELNRNVSTLRGQVEEILARVDSLPIIDARSGDEILGYDQNGVPA